MNSLRQSKTTSKEGKHYNTQMTMFASKMAPFRRKVVRKFLLAKVQQYDLGMPCPIQVAWPEDCSHATSKDKQQRRRTAFERV